jgi:hypothetical protein
MLLIMSCETYNFNIQDLFVPSLNIYNKLCISYDKTNMFIIGFLRTILILFLSRTNFINNEIKLLLNGLTIINFIILFYIFNKNIKYDEFNNKLENENIKTKIINEFPEGYGTPVY